MSTNTMLPSKSSSCFLNDQPKETTVLKSYVSLAKESGLQPIS